MIASVTTNRMHNLFISCEHASNLVPEQLRTILGKKVQLLRSHRSYDQGALGAAERIAEATGAPLIRGKYTRLAVDLNRSEKNPQRFSRYSRQLDSEVLELLEKKFYIPYRNDIKKSITEIVQKKSSVLHLSIHSFTPVLDGVKRDADIGLLYDPSRIDERLFASRMKTELARIAPEVKVRYNYPYRGVSDGITTWLRKHFTGDEYVGLEIEFNQRLLRNIPGWNTCIQNFIAALGKVQEIEPGIDT